MKTTITTAAAILLTFYFMNFIAFNSLAQITFQKTYGGASTEGGHSVQQTTDGGYIIRGETRSFGAGWSDVYLIKTDENGDTTWTKTYGGTSLENWSTNSGLTDADIQTSDDGYLIIGWTQSFGAGNKDVYMIKTDANGDTLWTKAYGGANEDRGYSGQQTADGGYIITGETKSYGITNGNDNIYLLKTDNTGTLQWTKTYSTGPNEIGYSVKQTTDGGYIFTGYTSSFTSGIYLIKTNNVGDTLWTKMYGTGGGTGNFVEQTSDGGYIIAGSASIGAFQDAVLIKTNNVGDTLWTKTFGMTGHDRFNCVQQTTDGGYIVSGTTNNGASSNYLLVKLDASGDTLWTKVNGEAVGIGGGNEYGYGVAQTADGGYAFVGMGLAGGVDLYFIKTDANGVSGCNTRNDIVTVGCLNTTVTSAPFTVGSGGIENNTATVVGNGSPTVLDVACFSLPIELLTFDAIPVKDNNNKYYVRCEWSTATEINNDYFTVERSKDGKVFANIGTRQGAGNNTTTLHYEFDDWAPYTGLSYYQLKQTDYDGNYSYSRIVAVYIGEMDIINISPSPAEKEIEYTIKISETSSAQVKIINVLGQAVINHTETIEKGVTQKKIDISMLASGYYMLSINTEQLGKTEKKFAVK